MAQLQITCITKPNVNSPHEHITHVGGNWTPRIITVEQAIREIRTKSNSFYVLDGRGNRAEVGVVDGTAGRRDYLRTYANGQWSDNLLSLNQCVL